MPVSPYVPWRNRPRKSFLLVPLPFAAVIGVLCIVIYPWMKRVDLVDPAFANLARLNVIIWMLILWWSLHHLTFQLAALFKLPADDPADMSTPEIRFAVLYLTCDDFSPLACESCLVQKYDPALFCLLICDDSNDADRRAEIDSFIEQHKSSDYPDFIRVVRRGNRKGFKAGNLNHVFKHEVGSEVEWVVVLDADQVLPPDYLTRLAAAVAEQPSDVAFVQTGHNPGEAAKSGRNAFQLALDMEVMVFYERDLAWRERYGFLPALGHGIAVRSSSWRELGGFPELVSEDYAFALRASGRGIRGIYLEKIRSDESFPRDFGAFTVRLCKFAGGSAELLRREVGGFLLSRATWTEKLDFVMLLLWYPLLPLLLFNGFLSAYVCHRWWILGVSALHPVLPYLFLLMFFLIFPVLRSEARGWLHAVRYWFWAVAVYSATLPIAAWRFLLHLFKQPVFVRTPKGADEASGFIAAAVVMPVLGLLAIGLSILWWSPFSPVLASYGTAYASFPIYRYLHRLSLIGKVARTLVMAPGALLLVALYTMWFWGRL